MAALIQSSLPTIMQAVEQQLLTYIWPATKKSIAGDISNIYWVQEGDNPEPGQTGQRDILLVEKSDDPESSVVGAGRYAWFKSGLEVNLRSSLASDRRGTRRQWLIEHRALIDALLSALMGFFPVDADDNALTVEGFVLTANSSPRRHNDPYSHWGYTIGSYEFHYVPGIDTDILG